MAICPPKALAKWTRKSMQVDAKPVLARRLASSHKSQKVVNFTHIQLTCDQLVSTCVGWPNGEKLAYEFVLDQSQCKWVAK